MSTITLNNSNFVQVRLQNGKTSVNVNINGVVVVFFKSKDCKGCSHMEPIFGRFSNSTRIKTAEICLTKYRNLIGMFRNSTTPIQSTPHLIMYVDGRPHAVYRGKTNSNELDNFINGALSKIQQRSFVQQQPQQNFYGGQQINENAYYKPDINPPRSAINIARSGGDNYGAVHPSMQECDSDDEDCLLTPKTIIPHNTPWESDFKRITNKL